RLQGPANADAVTAHNHRMILLLVVRVVRAELLGILGAEDKDVSHLNPTPELERMAAHGVGFASLHATKVLELIDLEIARHIHVPHMEAVLIRARGTIAYQSNGQVGINSGKRRRVRDCTLDGAKTSGSRS